MGKLCLPTKFQHQEIGEITVFYAVLVFTLPVREFLLRKQGFCLEQMKEKQRKNYDLF